MSRPLLHIVTPDDHSGSTAVSNEGADRDDLSNPAARRQACAGRDITSRQHPDAADAAPGGAAAPAADAAAASPRTSADAEASRSVIMHGGEAGRGARLALYDQAVRLDADAAALRDAMLDAGGPPVLLAVEPALLHHLIARGWRLQILRRGVRAVRVRVLYVPPMHEART